MKRWDFDLVKNNNGITSIYNLSRQKTLYPYWFKHGLIINTFISRVKGLP